MEFQSFRIIGLLSEHWARLGDPSNVYVGFLRHICSRTMGPHFERFVPFKIIIRNTKTNLQVWATSTSKWLSLKIVYSYIKSDY